jgi:alpha-glucosidase/alpha-D-xyloside xylohydrolase
MQKQPSAISRRQALIGLGTAIVASADTEPRPSGSGRAEPTTLRIDAVRVELVLSSLSQAILRLTLKFSGTRGLDTDPVLALSSKPRLLFEKGDMDPSQTIAWESRRVHITSSPLSVSIENSDGKSIQSFRISTDGSVTFQKSPGPVFGLGEGGPQFDRRGQEYTMRNGQFGPLLSTIGARMPIPWLISSDGWAVFFHQPYGIVNLSGSQYVFEQPDVAVENAVPLDIFFAVSDDPKEIVRAYAQITGFPHMPPRWALGYQQSHRTLSSREEILEEAKKFRDDKLPCDTMIYLGTGFCPSGWNTGHGSFTFNQRVFPDPKSIIDELHQQHFQVALHLTRPPKHLHGGVTDTAVSTDDMSDAAYYWARHLDVFRLGVDGWWPDEGDPLGPEARLTRNRMYWEGPIKERPNKRPFALHRNGYAGLQRYGWLWSGDVDCTWKTLRDQIPVALNTGLSGLPYWGTDTGGFVPTKEFTAELYVRWFQFSAFCPLFRSHGRNWKLRLPWGWNTGEVGPVESEAVPDPKELHNPQVEPICRKYLELRYRLLPYTYTAVRTAHETGLPVMRALWLDYPGDPEAVASGSQYLWGNDLLVAPVTEPGATSKRVYLPAGIWYDFWTGERTQGGKTLERPVDLATMPLYVRAGAVLPLGPVKQYTEQSSDQPVVLKVHPGTSSQSSVYADDGESFDYERGEFMRLSLKWDDSKSQLAVDLAPESKRVWPEYRSLYIELPSGEKRTGIEFNGKPIVVQL